MDNIELVKGMYAAFQRGDAASIVNSTTEDVDWYEPGPSAIPYAGRYRGHAGVQEFFTKIAESCDVLAFEPREFLSAEGQVAVTGSWRFRVKQTGREAEVEWAMHFRIRDGKVCRFQAYLDTAATAAPHELAATA